MTCSPDWLRWVATSSTQSLPALVTDAGLRSLAAFTSLRTLDLSHTSITSSGLVALEKLGALETLNLTATRVDDAGVEPLRRRSTLFETRATH